MKILFITHTTDTAFGGWGRYTHDFARALRGRGHEVVAINEWLSANSEPPLHEPLSYLGINTWPQDIFLVRKVVREFRPDIIHITVEPYMLLLPFLPLQGIKVFLTLHGTYAYLPALISRKLRPLYRSLTAWAVRRVSAAITVSTHTKNHYLKISAHDRGAFSEDRLHVITTGVVLSEFGVVARKKSDIFTIISVGAVKVRKGILETIRALGQYKKKFNTQFRYYVIGPKDEEDRYVKLLRQAIEEENLEEEALLLGKIDNESLQDMYARADALIMLPIEGSHFEGFGVIYLEANAYGVPTIGAKGTVSEESIRDGFSGLLGDPNNPEEMAEVINRIANSAISSQNARAFAEEFEINKMAGKVNELYNKFIS